MIKALSQKLLKQDDAIQASLKDHGAGSNIWTCCYKAKRKLWILQKVRKAHCPENRPKA